MLEMKYKNRTKIDYGPKTMPKMKCVIQFHVSRGLLGELIIFLNRKNNIRIHVRVTLSCVPVTIVEVENL